MKNEINKNSLNIWNNNYAPRRSQYTQMQLFQFTTW